MSGVTNSSKCQSPRCRDGFGSLRDVCEDDDMNSLTDDARLIELLDELYRLNDAQNQAIDDYYANGAERPTGFEEEDSSSRNFWRDKFVAIDRDKAEFVYLLCRSIAATRIIEAGTSFGVSTLFLAAAARDNGGGLVTTCDNEPTKMAVARQNFEIAMLSDSIDTRTGDIRNTLLNVDKPIDFLLLDIWAPIAADVVQLVGPHIRPGGVIVADNTAVRRNLYDGLFEYLEKPENGFTTRTLPFDGGLEVAVKTS